MPPLLFSTSSPRILEIGTFLVHQMATLHFEYCFARWLPKTRSPATIRWEVDSGSAPSADECEGRAKYSSGRQNIFLSLSGCRLKQLLRNLSTIHADPTAKHKRLKVKSRSPDVGQACGPEQLQRKSLLHISYPVSWHRFPNPSG